MTLFEPEPEARRRIANCVPFGAWVGVTAIAAYLKPDVHGHGTHQQLGLPPCPSVLLFDRPCPGCGMTTSWTAFVHGDFATAFHAHPLGPATYLIFTLIAWSILVASLRGYRLVSEGAAFNRMLIAVCVIFIGFGAFRMATTPHYATTRERIISALSTN